MTKEDLNRLSEIITEVSNGFEDKPITENVKLLREDFDIQSIKPPGYYREAMDELEEVFREARLLFLYSILNRVCKEEGKLYHFDSPHEAGMRYDGVIKKEGSFYILDEDGDYGDIFSSEKFTRFIDDMYWELYGE